MLVLIILKIMSWKIIVWQKFNIVAALFSVLERVHDMMISIA